jgi:RimJ/RimL family protein N-acetyltransferase
MGVDPSKLPDPQEWLARMLAEHELPGERKDRYYLAWWYEGRQVGHSSLGQIRPGEDAFIHLHLWEPQLRKLGLGTEFFQRSVALAVERFGLQRIYCEPYAGNPAPNRVLEKAGFRFVRRYRTVPGPINHEQEVNRYVFETAKSGTVG